MRRHALLVRDNPPPLKSASSRKSDQGFCDQVPQAYFFKVKASHLERKGRPPLPGRQTPLLKGNSRREMAFRGGRTLGGKSFRKRQPASAQVGLPQV